MKKLKLIIISLVIAFLSITPLNAASFGISSSVKEVGPNETFTVSVGGDCIGRVDLSVSNGTLSTSSVWVEEGYVSVRVTANGSGTVVVTATPVTGFSDSDANLYNPGSKKISINIVAKNSSSSSNSNSNSNSSSKPNKPTVQKSNDNNLSELTINNGELTPSFNANTLEYKINLNKNTSSITINATPKDSKARVEGIGEINLKPGNNNIEIKVTAENGEIKIYKILAYVDDTPEVYIEYKKEKIGILRNFEGVTIPEGFNKEEIKTKDNVISIFKNGNITIVFGINEKNEKKTYLYDEKENKILNKLTILNINNKIIYIIDQESKRKNFSLEKININETEIECYKFNNKNDYCLMTAINNEGKHIEYLYESSENTIQLFPYFLLKENKNNNNVILLPIIAVITVLLILLSIIAYLIKELKKSKTETYETKELIKKLEAEKSKKRGKKNEKTK